MAQGLMEQFKDISNVEIIYANFMDYTISENGVYKFFSNIPFNITADILSKVFDLEGVQDIYFIIQYEAFLKYSGMPYFKECLKSLLYKPFFEMELIHEFAPSDFIPKPNARIVFARFTPRVKSDIDRKHKESYLDFLAFLFSEKGETLKDKVKQIMSYEQIKRTARDIGFSFNCIISEVTYQQWLAIFEIYLTYVPSEKKYLVKGAYNRLVCEQEKLIKMHRNRKRNGGASRNGKRKIN